MFRGKRAWPSRRFGFGRGTPSGLDAAPGRKPCAPLTEGNYFQPQAVLHRQGRQLTPLMKEFIEFLKQPDPAA
jgi:hypothetical protein